MLAVQPKPEGMNLRKVTLTASPGSAPSMNTGPLTGLTLAKSTVATSAAVELRVKWPAPESRHSKWMVSPGLQRESGLEVAAPGVIVVLAMDGVVAGDAHENSPELSGDAARLRGRR